MWTLLASVVWAGTCDVGSVDAESWRWQLDQAATHLAGGDIALGQATLRSARNRAPCLDELVDKDALTLLARLEAVSAYYQQEIDLVDEWAKLAALVSPMSPWPTWLDDTHQARRYLDRPPPDWSEWPDTPSVEAPKRGGVFVNGVWLDRPMFPTATPCLVQVLDHTGAPTAAWWQHGAAATPQLLPSDDPPRRPRFYDGPAVSDVRKR